MCTGHRHLTPQTLEFFILAGDASRDRRVDLADLLILAQNYGNSLIRAEPRAPLFGRRAISTRSTLEPEEAGLLA